MDKPKIYAIYSFLGKLSEEGGDQINEIATLRSLSTYFDVYYNNQLFRPDADGFGFSKPQVEMPDREYDLVYSRSNKDVFWEAKAKGLRTAYFGEFDNEIYAAADAIVTFNETTKRFMQARMRGEEVYPAFDAMFPSHFSCSGNILVFEQSGRADFSNCTGSVTARKLRMTWGDEFVMGFFGRISDICMPNIAIEALPSVMHEIPDARLVMAGKVNKGHTKKPNIIYENAYYTADQMPHVMSACDVLVGIEQQEAEWAGSNRALDAARCGVPFLTKPYSARREQLGDEYPLYYEDADAFYNKVMRLRYDEAFRQHVSDYLRYAADRLDPLQIRRRNTDRVRQFLGV